MANRSIRGGVALVLTALAATGCGGGGGTEPAQPSPDVTGTIIDTWWQSDGTSVARPRVPAGLAISAYLPQAGGGYRIIPGTVGADGHFTIPGVGFDTYFVAVDEPGAGLRLLERTDHLLKLGYGKVGRPDPVVAAAPSLLSFQLTGLQPWKGGDKLELSSAGTNLSGLAYGGGLSAGNSGGTATFNLTGLPLPAAGDLGWIVQYSSATPTPGGPSHEVATRCAILQAVQTMADGDVVTLGPVPLSTPAAQGTVGVDLRGSEFAALAPALGSATVTPSSTEVTVYASPRGPGGGPHTRLLRATRSAAPWDVDFGTLDFPRFFPAAFVEWRKVVSIVQVRYAGLAQPNFAYANSIAEPVASASAVIRPGLGPVQAFRIGDRDLTQPQAGVGLAPTITWSPPALGSPSGYGILIMDVTGTAWSAVLSVNTSQTRFELPAGLLQAGHTYQATIWATMMTGYDSAAPVGTTGRSESTAMPSEPFTP